MQAWLQKGNRGVGFDHKAAQEKQAREQQRKGDEAAAKRRAEAAAQRVVGDERSRKLAKIVEDELKGGPGGEGVVGYCTLPASAAGARQCLSTKSSWCSGSSFLSRVSCATPAPLGM